ncbi:MAG: PrsW family intramembrane metalloprotease [Paludibacteraceae bacterium]
MVEEMKAAVIIFAAILPAFLLVLYIWLRDKYQREPFSEVMKAVGLGVLSAFLAALIEGLLQGWGIVRENPTTLLGAAWNAFVGAAIPEECVKLLVLSLFLRRNRYFDERFDGIVYACAVGMGFAGTENIAYLFNNINDWETVAIQRAAFAVPGHFMFAVAMGYFYSLIYFGDVSWRMRGRILWVPVLLHGVYDALLMMADIGTALSSILIAVFYAFCFMMFRFGRNHIKKHIQRDENDPNQVAFWRK